MISLAFVTNVFTIKKIVNTCKKNFVLSIKNIKIKNITKSMKKYDLNIFYKIKIFIYNIK